MDESSHIKLKNIYLEKSNRIQLYKLKTGTTIKNIRRGHNPYTLQKSTEQTHHNSIHSLFSLLVEIYNIYYIIYHIIKYHIILISYHITLYILSFKLTY